MVHLAVGLVVLAVTCVVLTLVGWREVGTAFAVGAFAALATAGALLAYVVRHRM